MTSTPGFASSGYTAGQLNALVKILNAKGEDTVQTILSGIEFALTFPLLNLFQEIVSPEQKEEINLQDLLEKAPLQFSFELMGLVSVLLDKMRSISGIPAITLQRFDLQRAANSDKVSKELPVGIDLDSFFIHFVWLMSQGLDGELGKTLSRINPGCINLFLVQVDGNDAFIAVYWNGDNREWYCDIYTSLSNFGWKAGYQFFCFVESSDSSDN